MAGHFTHYAVTGYASVCATCTLSASATVQVAHTLAHPLNRYKNIKNEVENEEPLKALLKIQMKKGDNRDIILAWKDLIHFYIQFDKCEQAYKNFIEMKNKVDRSAFYEIGHLKFMLEDCMDLICKYEETAANQNQEQIQKDINDLWDWAKPFIKELSDNMHGNLYKKSIEAAETVNDQFAEELLEKYVLWEMRMKL